MELKVYDPTPSAHEYLTQVYLKGLRQYAAKNGPPLIDVENLDDVRNSTLLCLSDYLTPAVIDRLKNNGNKIVAFSITDSSYISQCCRAGEQMQKLDLIFALTGLQKVNYGFEFIVDPAFNIKLEKRQFLPEEDWEVFDKMRVYGMLQSLPYVHWEPLPDVPIKPYSQRSQKVLIRGGNHMRRFILALKLSKLDLLDVNSGFTTEPYFSDDMRPEFRYCESCRKVWKKKRRFPHNQAAFSQCACHVPPFDNLGQWNNVSPALFYRYAELFGHSHGPFDPNVLERLLNAEWLQTKAHQEMLARITFTSDCKWLFSIYAAQRFWDAAAVGCINVLPARSMHQDYFPVIKPDHHYLVYDENMGFLNDAFSISEEEYNYIYTNALEVYCAWIKPTNFTINTNLAKHIIKTIEQYAST